MVGHHFEVRDIKTVPGSCFLKDHLKPFIYAVSQYLAAVFGAEDDMVLTAVHKMLCFMIVAAVLKCFHRSIILQKLTDVKVVSLSSALT